MSNTDSILSQRSNAGVGQRLTSILRRSEKEQENTCKSGGDGHGVFTSSDSPTTLPTGNFDEVTGDYGSWDTKNGDDGVLTVFEGIGMGIRTRTSGGREGGTYR